MSQVRAVVMRAPGINCDAETMHGWRLAGAEPRLVHLNELIGNPALLGEARILTIPGGFSYGDDIAAGAILGERIAVHLGEAIREFVRGDKLVLGICNGFQVLVRMGLLPGWADSTERVTLTNNASGRFEDRWVRMKVCDNPCPVLADLKYIEAPVGHAEGRIAIDSPQTLDRLRSGGHVALRYVDERGEPAEYPQNPNGSIDAIAGLTDATGKVLGFMPHPDRHLDPTQHPLWTRRGPGGVADGLALFRAAVRCMS